MLHSDISNFPLLPVRDQGKVGTCLAFATSSAHENFHNVREYLSPAYLFGLAWKTDSKLNGHNGLTFEAVKNVISVAGQVHEKYLPYEQWMTGVNYPNSNYLPHVHHFNSDLINISCDFEEISNYIKQKNPVIIGIKISDAFHQVDQYGYIDEQKERDLGGHAILAIGIFQNKQSQKYFLIRNSWGDEWGVEGHAYISEEYFKDRVICAAILSEGEK